MTVPRIYVGDEAIYIILEATEVNGLNMSVTSWLFMRAMGKLPRTMLRAVACCRARLQTASRPEVPLAQHALHRRLALRVVRPKHARMVLCISGTGGTCTRF